MVVLTIIAVHWRRPKRVVLGSCLWCRFGPGRCLRRCPEEGDDAVPDAPMRAPEKVEQDQPRISTTEQLMDGKSARTLR